MGVDALKLDLIQFAGCTHVSAFLGDARGGERGLCSMILHGLVTKTGMWDCPVLMSRWSFFCRILNDSTCCFCVLDCGLSYAMWLAT